MANKANKSPARTHVGVRRIRNRHNCFKVRYYVATKIYMRQEQHQHVVCARRACGSILKLCNGPAAAAAAAASRRAYMQALRTLCTRIQGHVSKLFIQICEVHFGGFASEHQRTFSYILLQKKRVTSQRWVTIRQGNLRALS